MMNVIFYSPSQLVLFNYLSRVVFRLCNQKIFARVSTEEAFAICQAFVRCNLSHMFSSSQLRLPRLRSHCYRSFEFGLFAHCCLEFGCLARRRVDIRRIFILCFDFGCMFSSMSAGNFRRVRGSSDKQ